MDGVGGPKTKAATQSFQSDRCLGVDGVIGPQTLAGLTSVVKQVQAKAGAPSNGDYGTPTTSAVKSYQAAHHLSADGIAGEQTMKAMGIERLVKSCHATTGLRARIVKTAKSQIGVTADSHECVPGKPYSVCNEWCAAFATWVWRQSGADIPFMTYVPRVYDWAVAAPPVGRHQRPRYREARRPHHLRQRAQPIPHRRRRPGQRWDRARHLGQHVQPRPSRPARRLRQELPAVRIRLLRPGAPVADHAQPSRRSLSVPWAPQGPVHGVAGPGGPATPAMTDHGTRAERQR